MDPIISTKLFSQILVIIWFNSIQNRFIKDPYNLIWSTESYVIIWTRGTEQLNPLKWKFRQPSEVFVLRKKLSVQYGKNILFDSLNLPISNNFRRKKNNCVSQIFCHFFIYILILNFSIKGICHVPENQKKDKIQNQ
jgi:hypothetical protein